MDNQPVINSGHLLSTDPSHCAQSGRPHRISQAAFKPKNLTPAWLKCGLIWLALLTAGLPQAHAGNSASQIMSSAMLAMMDSMGDLAHRYRQRNNWYSDSYHVTPYPNTFYAPLTYPDYYPPAQPSPPYTPTPYYPTEPHSEVDGIWIGQGGEIVLVMYGYFRIYADTETYRDGRYEIDHDLLHMHNPANGVSQTYQYALDNGRMIMRNREGQILLFKQLPIPLPPQSLWARPEPDTEPSSEAEATEAPIEAAE
jgi:hypothetical protein